MSLASREGTKVLTASDYLGNEQRITTDDMGQCEHVARQEFAVFTLQYTKPITV